MEQFLCSPRYAHYSMTTSQYSFYKEKRFTKGQPDAARVSTLMCRSTHDSYEMLRFFIHHVDSKGVERSSSVSSAILITWTSSR